MRTAETYKCKEAEGKRRENLDCGKGALRAAAGGRAGRKKEEFRMRNEIAGAVRRHCGLRNAGNDEKRTQSDQGKRIKSEQIRPNQTKSDQKRSQRGSRRRPLDQ